MNKEELKQDNVKSHHLEERTIVTVWLPISIKAWYRQNNISKSKVLIQFAEEQDSGLKPKETAKETAKEVAKEVAKECP